MAGTRWTEVPRRFAQELARDLRGLRGNERLAVAGVAVILASLPLPWYSASVGDLVRTGLGSFSWTEGAILLTCAAVVFLAMEVGGGYSPPSPLSEGGLFIAAGTWIALIVLYRMVDRPELRVDLIVPFERDYGLGYGIFVALGGAVIIVAAGVRLRSASSRLRSRRSPSPER